MAEISAADVAKLRKMTGAGMMDCKLALTDAAGDFNKAIEFIRERGKAIANKRTDRDAKEGVVLSRISDCGKYGAMIVLNCETDFVAKNEAFVTFANSILNVAIANRPADLDALKALPLEGTTVEEKVTMQSGVIGEKIEVSFFDCVAGEQVIAYIHPGNRLATLASFNVGGLDMQVYRDVAMQIAAMDPVAIDRGDVPQEIRDEEFKIGREQARLEGKPEQMLDKIAEGRLNKFYQEKTLLNQEFVKDNKVNVGQYLKSNHKELTVTAFKRYTLNV
ncbi:MAG: translation elongation factor Ts [Bacteroidales bacterium]|nr:translation elongation factor Ts [Bacteroidales bacterium]